jgi:hypothetical protein
MNADSEFTVLIERRGLRSALAWMLASALLLVAPFGLQNAHAQTAPSKIAKDLQAVIDASTTPSLNWVKDVYTVRMVKVLIVSNSTDPDLTALRSDVIARKGAVYMRYVSVNALSAMLPATCKASRPTASLHALRARLNTQPAR